MKNSKQNIDVIRPNIFADSKNIEAWFIPKNPLISSSESTINGLNLGLNTADPNTIVQKNRSFLFNKLTINPKDVALANQVHGIRVQEITKGGTYGETDGLITRIPGLTLAIQVADCAALLLADIQNHVIAAVHAGWRGAAGGIVENAIEKMNQIGSSPEQIRAFISPCISFSKFEVGDEVAEQFPDEFVDYTSFTKPHVDLKAFLASSMEQQGVANSQIEIHPGCTLKNDEFYSYRREGKASGRMMALIQLNRK